MEDQTVVADPTPAMEVEQGPLVNLTSDQRIEFRRTGELPTPPKTEEAAASPGPKPEEAQAKPVGDSEPPKAQEKPKVEPRPKQTAEERIAQLESTIEKIRKGSGLDKPKADPAPAEPKPKPVQQSQAEKEPTVDDLGPDGTPKFKSYEEFTRALARWEVRQELQQQERERQQAAQSREFNTKVEAARDRYENFDEVVGPTATAINEDASVSPVVRQMLLDSDVLPDLLFTIGSDAADMAKFVKMAREAPGKALRYIALTESLINDELHAAKEPKAGEEPPVKPQTRAPRPPSEAGGRAATPPDALEAAAKANDFRAFNAEANRRALAKLKA